MKNTLKLIIGLVISISIIPVFGDQTSERIIHEDEYMNLRTGDMFSLEEIYSFKEFISPHSKGASMRMCACSCSFRGTYSIVTESLDNGKTCDIRSKWGGRCDGIFYCPQHPQ